MTGFIRTMKKRKKMKSLFIIHFSFVSSPFRSNWHTTPFLSTTKCFCASSASSVSPRSFCVSSAAQKCSPSRGWPSSAQHSSHSSAPSHTPSSPPSPEDHLGGNYNSSFSFFFLSSFFLSFLLLLLLLLTTTTTTTTILILILILLLIINCWLWFCFD